MTNSVLRLTLLACFVHAGSVFFASSAIAQNTSEIGIGIGGLNYKGEISPNYQFQNNRPALTVFYRKDISAPVTLRGAFTGGFLRADDANVNGINGKQAPLSTYRNANMKGHLLELSGVLEYNFFDYHYRKDKSHFTPYVFVGLAGFYTKTTTESRFDKRQGSLLNFAVPAGLGFKIGLSEHWNLGLEAGARKTFTDQIDHLSDQDATYANKHDMDWYFYNGVSISYTFFKIRCPDQYKRNPKLLK
ncbi:MULTISPECIES: type IX secretion system protein PorG [Hymenobacter]|uniref:Porin family protein n=1 Tax=Hymenobacter jejuensis TaxID=2502781 RepID=A0A5B7ZXM9_9BACT|nr:MULTISPECIES: DUF6089 family protein [Hymenobacter]MBC6991401.1 outer membrane beta-barrel protein [Hymenobacter sp. BT491]QDA59738.1 porin family protein [Hymenobacter jejuensis]